MQGSLERSEDYASQAERLVLSSGASFLLAMLRLARGIAAISAGRHSEPFEHLQRLFAPADPAFNSGLQFFALADFVEAAVYSGRLQECPLISEWQNPARALGLLEGKSLQTNITLIRYVTDVVGEGPTLHVHPYDEIFELDSPSATGPSMLKQVTSFWVPQTFRTAIRTLGLDAP